MEEWSEDAPGLNKLIRAHEELLLSLGAIIQHSLVGVAIVGPFEGLVVRQIENLRHDIHLQSRFLDVDLEVHGLVGLNADDELIYIRRIAKDTVGFRFEPNAHLALPLIQSLSRGHEEGDSPPPVILHGHLDHGVCRDFGVLGNCLVIEVPRVHSLLTVVAELACGELAEDDILHLDSLDRLEEVKFSLRCCLVAKVLRLLDADHDHHLQKMVLDDVADDAVLVEVSPPTHGVEVFFPLDVDGVDVLVAPQWLEYLVAEPEGKDVEYHLLAEVVVNSVELALLEMLRCGLRQFSKRLAVASKRLFQNKAREPCLGVAQSFDLFGHGGIREGREGKEKHAVVRALLVGRVLRDGRIKRFEVVVHFRLHVRQVGKEEFLLGLRHFHGLLAQQILDLHLTTSCADDVGVLGNEPLLHQGTERRE
mmetsp:Transcript_892/g.1629  ORF Transcript_892/g.1629 Transcript_892/m.1629 type:complete len:421 (+) Transcript_892:687-1949(+)